VPNDDEVAAPAVNAFTVYPNPVYLNHMISIKHSLQEQVKLDIFNIRGQKVKALSFDADNSIKWDLRNDKGEKLPAGVYLAKACNRQDLKPFKFVIIP
jgi:flagellar hook assembly protein FlgD